jgi:hypothetical protein
MTDRPRQQTGSNPADERARHLAAEAAGESVTADRLLIELRSNEPAAPETLLDLLSPDEKPQYLLEGLMIDRVRADGDRGRRMAPPDGGVYTLVTDRKIHVVVQYADSLARESIPLTTVRRTTIQQAVGEIRLGIDTGGERHEVYPSGTSVAETTAAAAYVDAWRGADEEDSVSAIERLAGLYERGLLTDEEFAAAKRDLLE